MTTAISWSGQQNEVLDRLKKTQTRLKIILKTKDDAFFLPSWLDHHARIVGRENITIFDNESTNESTLAFYRGADDLSIVNFQGFHNNIHAMWLFLPLYEALRASCEYYLFIDTDEFLVYFDGQRFISDANVLSALQSELDGDFIPTTWLMNVPLHRTRFHCGTSPAILLSGLAWGKPIIRSSMERRGNTINHNCQVAEDGGRPIPLKGFYLLHMAYLSVEQRVRVNRQKLVARGFLEKDEPAESVLQKNLDNATVNERIYASEIINLLKTLSSGKAQIIETSDSLLDAGTMQIDSEGHPSFASALESEFFTSFEHDFPDACRKAFPLQK